MKISHLEIHNCRVTPNHTRHLCLPILFFWKNNNKESNGNVYSINHLKGIWSPFFWTKPVLSRQLRHSPKVSAQYRFHCALIFRWRRKVLQMISFWKQYYYTINIVSLCVNIYTLLLLSWSSNIIFLLFLLTKIRKAQTYIFPRVTKNNRTVIPNCARGVTSYRKTFMEVCVLFHF